MKTLLLTVGGSDAPLVTSINHYRPDYVVFLATKNNGLNKGSQETVNGEGMVCKERSCPECGHKNKDDRPSIVQQTGLSDDSFQIAIVEADNPYDCYKTAGNIISTYLSEGHEVIVDYTGGTKSMSVGLAMASMEFPQCKLSVVKGPRLDLVKVRDGMARVSKLPSNLVYTQRQYGLSQKVVKEWDYTASVRILEEIENHGYIEDEYEYSRKLYLSRGFAAWDKFDYKGAVPLIELFKNEENVKPYNKTLKKINAVLDWYKNWNPEDKRSLPVFVLVYDVLMNAERRAAQGNYDDAISRIYRALEMYGQFCLRTGEPRLTSEDLDVTQIPEDYREYYESKRGSNNKVQIGLTDDYDLLAHLKNPVGEVWQRWRSKVLQQVLQKRNYSFLAHGMQPLNEEDYRSVKEVVWEFIIACDEALKIKEGLARARQLPQEL